MLTNSKLRFTDEELEIAAAVDIVGIAQRIPGFELKKQPDGAYKVRKQGGLFLFPDTNTYYHHTADKAGNVISFLMEYQNYSFVDAVKDLLNEKNISFRTVNEYIRKPKGKMYLPKQDKDNLKVVDYLTKTRGINEDIVNLLISQNKVFQGNYFNKNENKYEIVCAFVGYDELGKARYCSMRGASDGSKIKQDKYNSDKKYCFHIEGKSNRLFVLEAPLEVLSHATLTKLAKSEPYVDHRLALGGMSTLSLERYLSIHKEINTIVFALNNDYDKINSKGEYENYGQNRADKLMEEYNRRGYSISKQVPVNVDFNDDLMCYRKHGRVFKEREPPRISLKKIKNEDYKSDIIQPISHNEAFFDEDEYDWLP